MHLPICVPLGVLGGVPALSMTNVPLRQRNSDFYEGRPAGHRSDRALMFAQAPKLVFLSVGYNRIEYPNCIGVLPRAKRMWYTVERPASQEESSSCFRLRPHQTSGGYMSAAMLHEWLSDTAVSMV